MRAILNNEGRMQRRKMLKKNNKMRKFSSLIFAALTFVFASIFFLTAFASAGNYRFQNTSGYDLMFMNGTSGTVGIGTMEARNE